jgi:hypothetical protein
VISNEAWYWARLPDGADTAAAPAAAPVGANASTPAAVLDLTDAAGRRARLGRGGRAGRAGFQPVGLWLSAQVSARLRPRCLLR